MTEPAKILPLTDEPELPFDLSTVYRDEERPRRGTWSEKSRENRWLAKEFLESLPAVSTDECVDWPFSIGTGGYGQLYYEGRRRTTHRAIFHLLYGYWPTVVRHTCDRRCCVNPRHLLEGTQKDNIHDAMERGRHVRPPKAKPAERHPGWRHDVDESYVLSLFATGMSQVKVAATAGISVTLASQIRRGVRGKMGKGSAA